MLGSLHNISTWSEDQYVEMAISLDWGKRNAGQEGTVSSYPSLCKTGLLQKTSSKTSESSQGKMEHSYDVPTLPGLEPEYVSIDSTFPYVPYLVPVKTRTDSRLHHDPPVHREYSLYSYDGMYVVPHQKHPQPPSLAPAPLSTDHDYEEVIDTTVSMAYSRDSQEGERGHTTAAVEAEAEHTHHLQQLLAGRAEIAMSADGAQTIVEDLN